MDSDFNDIEFLMGNIKQETPNMNGLGEPFAQGAQNNNTDQLAMSTYTPDLVLDYINISLFKEEETQPENNETVAPNEEESVEDLIERAENMIRENEEIMRQSQQTNISEAGATVTHNEWMQQFNTQLETREDNLEQSTNPAPASNRPAASSLTVAIEMPDVIFVDIVSDDEVIFVNSHRPLNEIPIVDLSDHVNEVYSNSTPTAQVSPVGPQENQFRHSCGICLDDINSPHSTTCGHIFCGDCIKSALKMFKKCPYCNKKLKISNVHPIYL